MTSSVSDLEGTLIITIANSNTGMVLIRNFDFIYSFFLVKWVTGHFFVSKGEFQATPPLSPYRWKFRLIAQYLGFRKSKILHSR
jgi:hypothetical protein